MLLFRDDEPDASVKLHPTSSNIEFPTQNHCIDALPHYGPYAFIRYQLKSPSPTPNTPRLPPPLTLHNTSTWTYCGPLLSSSAPSLPPSFHAWSTATISTPSTLLQHLIPLLTFLHTFLTQSSAHHYWLTIRTTKPTTEHNTPRWHVDDDFFNAVNDNSSTAGESRSVSRSRGWKLATTLLGPPTLFLENNAQALDILNHTQTREKDSMREHTCTSVRCAGCSTYADTVRQHLTVSLADMDTASPAADEVSFFRLGNEEGAVHSEPRCDVDRIFVNVIPGCEEDLRRLMGRWGMGFPRAWCLGVPGGVVGSDEPEWFSLQT